MNKLAEFYYKAVADVLSNKEMMLNQANEISESMLETCTLKAAQFNKDATRKIEFIRNELSESATYLNNPSAEIFLRLMTINDAQTYLENLKADLEARTEEDIKFKSIAHLYTKLRITVDDAEKYLEDAFNDHAKLVKEIKFSIVYVWAYHMYCQVLSAAEKQLHNYLLY